MRAIYQKTGVAETLFILIVGLFIGAGTATLALNDLHDNKLTIIQKDVKSLYDSFNQCHEINKELLKGYADAH